MKRIQTHMQVLDYNENVQNIRSKMFKTSVPLKITLF
jgi:hypothetical protein